MFQRGRSQHADTPGLRGLNVSRWWDRLHAEWIEDACAAVGVAPPPTFEERVDAAERALTIFYQNTRSFVPEAGPVIRALSERFEIHMASGNPAYTLETVLDRIGVRSLVGHPFGSDLLGLRKEHDRFYSAILETIGARAEETIVADDDVQMLAKAGSLGILTVKIGGTGDGAPDHAVDSFAELPDLLNSLE